MITQAELKEYLHYNPVTGIFTHIRKRKNANNISIGDTAGYIRPDGYVAININRKIYKAHKLAYLYVNGVFPDYIDHKNQNRGDNRISNLSLSTHKENHKNRSLQKNNTSGFCGVYWYPCMKKWCAKIKINQKTKMLGFFTDKEDAISARIKANKEFGFSVNHGSKSQFNYK